MKLRESKREIVGRVLCGTIAVLVLAFLIVGLRWVFSGEVILPQVVHLGPLTVHYYGLIMALALLAAYWLAARRAAAYGVTVAQLDRIIIVLVISGFIGARLYHVATDLSIYVQHPGQIFAVWQGGLSIFGALLGGILGLWWTTRTSMPKVPLLLALDWLAPSVLLGQIIGRFGNLFNYEIFGAATNLPWKMFVPAAFRPDLWLNSSYFHPLFLYEIVVNSFILVILLGGIKTKYRPGSLFFAYLFLYNAVRFFLEWYRIDNVFIGAVPVNALVAAALACVGVSGIIYLNHERLSSSHN